MSKVQVKNIELKLLNSVKAIMLKENPENKLNNTKVVEEALRHYKTSKGGINE